MKITIKHNPGTGSDILNRFCAFGLDYSVVTIGSTSTTVEVRHSQDLDAAIALAMDNDSDILSYVEAV